MNKANTICLIKRNSIAYSEFYSFYQEAFKINGLLFVRVPDKRIFISFIEGARSFVNIKFL